MFDKDTTLGGNKHGFPKTVWTEIITAKDRASVDFRRKFEELVSLYWKPVYVFIRVFWKKTNEEAKDLTQEYFSRFFEKDFLSAVSPEKGRFRTFVKVSLKRFLMDMKDKEMAQKRGGTKIKISFNDIKFNGGKAVESSMDPADFFDSQWASAVVSRCLNKLKVRLTEKQKGLYYEVFEQYYLNHDKGVTYLDVAKQFDIDEKKVNNQIYYAKTVLKRIIRDEVSKYVSTPEEAEEELKYLISIKL